MRLRSVKILRRSLIGIIVLILVAVLVDYVQIRQNRSRTVKKTPPILSSEMVRSAEGVKYFDYKGEVLRFQVQAKRLLETRMGKNLLEGIDASVFAPDGTTRIKISSSNAEVDQDHKVIYFTGNVLLQFSRGISVRSDSLRYDLNSDIATTPDLLRIQSDEVNGMARGLRFSENDRSLDFEDEVSFFLSSTGEESGRPEAVRKLHAVSKRAHYSDLMHRIFFQGDARVESDSGTLTGDNIEAMLSPDQRNLTSLVADGQTSYTSKIQAETRTLSGDTMAFNIGASNELERIVVEGQAAFASVSPSAEQSLKGGAINLEFGGSQSALTAMRSRNAVMFQMKRGTERAEISGEELDAQFVPGQNRVSSIQVRQRSKLILASERNAEESEMRADEIDMNFSGEGEFLESSKASGNVQILRNSSGPSEPMRVRSLNADFAQFHFFAQSGSPLKDMNADGHVQITYIKDPVRDDNSAIRTESNKMKATFELRNGNSSIKNITQWEKFSYRDTSKSATAGVCEYDGERGMLILKESPRISDTTGSTTGEWMEYDQRQEKLSVHHKVESLLKRSDSEGTFLGSSGSASTAVVKADEMQSWTKTGRFQYTGNVGLFSEDQQLRAQSLDIYDNGSRLEARGEIRHILYGNKSFAVTSGLKSKGSQKSAKAPTIIRSQSLNYIKKGNELTYSGKVSVQSEGMYLSSDSLDIIWDKDGKKVEIAAAHDHIFIRENGLECKGDSADWNLNTGKIVVVGDHAEVFDPKLSRRSFARRLTWSTTDDTIWLENH